jgi:hypothetical protein
MYIRVGFVPRAYVKMDFWYYRFQYPNENIMGVFFLLGAITSRYPKLIWIGAF